jgi:hypothetical protein
LSCSWIYIRNLGTLVYPHQLCCDWTGGAIPNVQTLGDWRVKWIGALYVAVAAWVAWVLRARALPKVSVREPSSGPPWVLRARALPKVSVREPSSGPPWRPNDQREVSEHERLSTSQV